ncbi:MAG: molybdopterin-dependent oxidoreductase [Candidatus Nealsonbacteria bacterium]|nr:molybdopterin-dependent oxidoreductase [Candidatus Nealsonbacteria bacterium]
MSERNLKYLVSGALSIAFLSSVITGIIKFPGLFRFFNINYALLPNRQINLVHDWSGLALTVLIFIHLFLNRKWIGNALSSELGESNVKVWHLIFLFLISGVLVLTWLFQNQIDPESRSKRLKSVEIREYEGENLSSVEDIGETSIKSTQYIDENNYSLTVSGLVDKPKSYSYDQVLSFPKYSKVVDLHCVVGWSAKILWEGILLEDILEDAGASPEAKIAIFYAKDGFTTSLPLNFIGDRDILLAYKINGVTLPPEKGFPFQVVAEQKWGYKWIKWLTEIELSDDLDYRGTYESRGYSNEADLDGPKLESN